MSSLQRRHGRYRLLLRCQVVVFLLLLLCTNADDDDAIKELPDKGDDACLTLDERQELSNQGDAGVWFNPCTVEEPSVEIPSNGISLPLYLATPAFSWSFDVPVAFLTVNYLSEDLAPAYSIRMPSLGLISIFSTFTPESDPTATIADIVLVDIRTEIIQQRSRKAWWRRYQLIFTCSWGPAATPSLQGLPITDPKVLNRLGMDLERSLRQFLDVLSVFELERLSNGTVAVGADDPRERPFAYQTFGNWSIATTDAIDGGGSDTITPIEPTTSLRETGSFTARVRASDWDWHRSLGLWMLLGTVAVTTLVSHAASARQRREQQASKWGTAAGVEALLDATRWKLDEAMAASPMHEDKETYPDKEEEKMEEDADLTDTILSETTISHRTTNLRSESEILHRIIEEDFYDEESVI